MSHKHNHTSYPPNTEAFLYEYIVGNYDEGMEQEHQQKQTRDLHNDKMSEIAVRVYQSKQQQLDRQTQQHDDEIMSSISSNRQPFTMIRGNNGHKRSGGSINGREKKKQKGSNKFSFGLLNNKQDISSKKTINKKAPVPSLVVSKSKQTKRQRSIGVKTTNKPTNTQTDPINRSNAATARPVKKSKKTKTKTKTKPKTKQRPNQGPKKAEPKTKPKTKPTTRLPSQRPNQRPRLPSRTNYL